MLRCSAWKWAVGETCANKEALDCLCKGSHFATGKSCLEHLGLKNTKIFIAQHCETYDEAL